MKEEILKGLKRSIPLILFLDIGFGVGPINWTLKGINTLRVKTQERKFKKMLKEGEIGIISLNDQGTKGYIYIKEEGQLVRSYFNEHINVPSWAKKSE